MSGAATHADEAYEPVFTGETLAALERKFAEYPTKQALLLPALWMVQEKRGWISEQAIGEVAQVLGITPAHVKGVITFYTMYHSTDGRFTVIEVECLGACGFATPVMVNEDFIESVTPETVPALLERYR